MHASHFLSCAYFCSSVVPANGPVLIAEWENSIPFCPRSLYKIINLKFLLYVCKYHQTFRSSCSNSIPRGFLKSAESFWKESRACMHAILCAIVRVLQRMFSILDHLPLLLLSSMSLTGCFCLFFAPTVCFFFSFFVHSVEEIWRFQNFFQVEVSSTWHIRKCQSWIWCSEAFKQLFT